MCVRVRWMGEGFGRRPQRRAGSTFTLIDDVVSIVVVRGNLRNEFTHFQFFASSGFAAKVNVNVMIFGALSGSSSRWPCTDYWLAPPCAVQFHAENRAS